MEQNPSICHFAQTSHLQTLPKNTKLKTESPIDHHRLTTVSNLYLDPTKDRENLQTTANHTVRWHPAFGRSTSDQTPLDFLEAPYYRVPRANNTATLWMQMIPARYSHVTRLIPALDHLNTFVILGVASCTVPRFLLRTHLHNAFPEVR